MPEAQLQDRWMTVADIAREYGKPRTTIQNWMKSGVGGRRLEGIKVGHNWQARESAVVRFFEQLTADALPASAPPIPDIITPQRAQREYDRVAESLRQKGIDLDNLDDDDERPRKIRKRKESAA